MTINADGTLTYNPNGAFDVLQVGDTDVDTFRYTISDQNGATDTALVRVVVSGVNDNPVAVDDSRTTDADAAIGLNVLSNDSDIDGGPLTVSAIDTTGTRGEVSFQANGQVLYNPTGAFDGLGDGETAFDSFIYTADDGLGGTDSATVTITVVGVSGDSADPAPAELAFFDVIDSDGPKALSTIDENGSDIDILVA